MLYVALGYHASLGVTILMTPLSDAYRASRKSCTKASGYSSAVVHYVAARKPSLSQSFQGVQVVVYAGMKEKQVLAGAFASLPVKVLWHATQREMDDATLNQLSLGSNTKVPAARVLPLQT